MQVDWALQDIEELTERPWQGGDTVLSSMSTARLRRAAKVIIESKGSGRVSELQTELEVHKAAYEILSAAVFGAIEVLGQVERLDSEPHSIDPVYDNLVEAGNQAQSIIDTHSLPMPEATTGTETAQRPNGTPNLIDYQ